MRPAPERALAESGADAVMIGRGAYGRPWIAREIDGDLDGREALEPGLDERLDIALDHLAETLAFYGDRIGLKIFRKHLGWYIEGAPLPMSTEARRAAKSRLCRLEQPAEVEAALIALWSGEPERLAA